MRKNIPFLLLSSIASLYGTTGIINNDVTIRVAPHNSAKEVEDIKKDKTIEIINKVNTESMGEWYQTPKGYIFSRFVTIVESDTEKAHPFNNPLYVDARTLAPSEKSQPFEDENGNIYTKQLIPAKELEDLRIVTPSIQNPQIVKEEIVHNTPLNVPIETPKLEVEQQKPIVQEKIKISQQSYQVPKGTIISNESLERAMLLTNDLAGVKVVGVTAIPGKVVGTSNFAIKTEATAPYNGYLIGDNYGSRYTGKNRLMGGVSVNSPLKGGDKLSLSGLITNSSDLKNGRVAYEMPLLPNGLKGELSYSKTEYELGNDKEIEELKLAGKSQTVEATLSYPIIRSRTETLKISSTLARKDIRDTQDDEIKTDKRLLSLATTLSDSKSTSLFGYDAQIDKGITLTLGSLRFDNSDAKDIDTDGAKTWGAYQKIGGNLESTIQFNPYYSFGTKFAFQHTLGDKNLDGGEDFSVGGANGVKVFPDGEHSAENGLTLSLEFFKHLPLSLDASNKIGFFYDLGYAKYQNSEYNEDLKTRTLQDVGVGYYLNYKSFFMKMQMARVVGDEKIKTEEIGNQSRFLFQGGWSF
jgi:hemolysin activation/secretion protein